MLVVSAILFGFMAFLAKLATARLPGPEVAFLRFSVGLAGVALASMTFVRLRPVNARSLFLRGLFGGLAVLLFFTAIEKLPVGTATLLNYTAPVFTAIDAWIFLGEAVSAATIGSLVLTLLGVTLVVQGGAQPGRFGFGVWELCGLASAVLSGAAVTAVRAARRTDGAWEIFAAFCLFGTMATAPFALRGWVDPTPREWWLMIAVGVVALVAQVLFGQAMRHVRAATAGVVMQLTPVTALALGVALHKDPLGPLAIAGSVLTLGGVSWAAWAPRRREAGEERKAEETPATAVSARGSGGARP